MIDPEIRQVQFRQGWTDETLLDLAMQFIEKQAILGEFIDHLEGVADEENAECAAAQPEEAEQPGDYVGEYGYD